MKYNKQLFDKINKEYENVISLENMIVDNLIDIENKEEVVKEFDIFIQSLLAKLIKSKDLKNPALYNMLNKLSKNESFYKGIPLDDWFNQKERINRLLDKKIEEISSSIPKLFIILVQQDKKTKTTEFSYQILESIISLLLTLEQDYNSYEEVEEQIINKYLNNLYNLLNE